MQKTTFVAAVSTIILSLAMNVYGQHQHAGDFLIGVSSGTNPQIKFELNESVLAGVTLLVPDSFGGFSTDAPGFDHVDVDEPDEDIYALAAGARIWLQIDSDVPNPALTDLKIAPALFVYEPLLFTFYPYAAGGNLHREVYLGDNLVHKHVLWFLDTADPAYSPGQCVWELTARFIDKGTTGYAASEPFTLRFALHALVPGDFDCDRDVDADDLVHFESCQAGPAVPLDPSCERYDLDGDMDADSTDFAIIQRCWSGAGVPGDPACAG